MLPASSRLDILQGERGPLCRRPGDTDTPIAEINAWNRLNVITRQLGGNYQPGQFG